jgi:hypothetical protein
MAQSREQEIYYYDRGFQAGMRKAVNELGGPYINEGEKIEFIKMCFRCDERTAYVRRKIYPEQDPWLVCGLCNEQ